jgi:hypothetical protein
VLSPEEEPHRGKVAELDDGFVVHDEGPKNVEEVVSINGAPSLS